VLCHSNNESTTQQTSCAKHVAVRSTSLCEARRCAKHVAMPKACSCGEAASLCRSLPALLHHGRPRGAARTGRPLCLPSAATVNEANVAVRSASLCRRHVAAAQPRRCAKHVAMPKACRCGEAASLCRRHVAAAKPRRYAERM